MTFASVLLFCLGAIAVCAVLVFVVETVVAFCVPEGEVFVEPVVTILSREQDRHEIALDHAA